MSPPHLACSTTSSLSSSSSSSCSGRGARADPGHVGLQVRRLDAWFFVSVGQLKQKKNQTVVSQNVFDKVRAAFCDGLRHVNDIAAVWAGGAPGSPARILHITRDNLLPFLLEMPDKGHGVLQRWITPTTEHNTLVRAMWTPHVFELECRQNSLSMHDHRHPLAERLATFEGDRPHVSTYTPSSGRINQHVLDSRPRTLPRRRAPSTSGARNSSPRAILRNSSARNSPTAQFPRPQVHGVARVGVLTFKADARGAVWLCWC